MDTLRRLIGLAKPLIEHFPRVATLYRNLRDSLQTFQEPVDTPMGFRLTGNKEIEKGMFEPEETEIVRTVLQQADVFINVGANIGYYCCLALKAKKQTVAFEPIESNLKNLYLNAKANEWAERIEVFPMALGNRIGIVEIYGGGTGASLVKGWDGASEQYRRLVPISTMDNVIGDRFSGKRCFILADIEGAEKDMLEGARKILNQNPKPIWMVEISISEHQPGGKDINPNLASTFEIFWKNGYESRTADSKLRLISPEEIYSIVRTRKDTILTHNFLFIEKGREFVVNP